MLQEFKDPVLWKKYSHIDFDLYLFKSTKIGIAGFLSHLEWLHSLERTFRRAQFPLWFSKGFHPIPEISCLRPLPTGVSSGCQYFTLRLKRQDAERDIDSLLQGFNVCAPSGFRLLWGAKVFDTFHIDKYACDWCFHLFVQTVLDRGSEEFRKLETILTAAEFFSVSQKKHGFVIEYIIKKDIWIDYREVLEGLYGSKTPPLFYVPLAKEVYFSFEKRISLQNLFSDLEDHSAQTNIGG